MNVKYYFMIIIIHHHATNFSVILDYILRKYHFIIITLLVQANLT